MSETRWLTEQLIDVWNRHDKHEWLSRTADNASLISTGGFSASGKQGAEAFYSMWQDAFPDTRVTARRIVSDGDVAILEGTFSGTHTGPLAAPTGPIPPTGKKVSTQFVNAITYSGDKIVASQVYFDQMELLTQLGLVPATPTVAVR